MEQMQEMLNQLSQEFKQFGLKMNLSKTTIMTNIESNIFDNFLGANELLKRWLKTHS